jgi:hypothetical protein
VNNDIENNSVANSIEKYDFDIVEVIKTSFKMIHGFKGTFWSSFVILLVSILAAAFLIGFIFLLLGIEPEATKNVIQFILLPISAPLAVGLYMISTKYTRGESVSYKNTTDYFPSMWKLAFAALTVIIIPLVAAVLILTMGMLLANEIITPIFTVIAIILFVVLTISYMFTPQLMVDKNLGIWEAMETSRKSIFHHIFKILGLLVVFAIVVLISAIPFGIGLIWAIPAMHIGTYGLLYRIIFDDVELDISK